MNRKQIIILCVILGVLAAGVFAKTALQSRNAAVVASSQVVSRPLFSVDSGKAQQILIGRGDKEFVELIREKDIPSASQAEIHPSSQGGWKVKNLWDAKADTEKVNEFFDKIRSMKGELRGAQKKLFPDFGIQDPEAFFIKVTGDNHATLLDLRVGSKQAGSAYFVRQAASDEVYLTDTDMARLLGVYMGFQEGVPSADVWADAVLFQLDPEKVTKITVHHLESNGSVMTAGVLLEQDGKDSARNVWKFIRPQPSAQMDPDNVLRFIATLNSIRTKKVVDPMGQGYGLENPAWQIAVTEGDREIVLALGAKDDKKEDYFVKITGKPGVFTLNSYYAEDLEIDNARFAKKTLQENPLASEMIPEPSFKADGTAL